MSRFVLIFVLPLDFHGRVRVVRSMYLPAALHWPLFLPLRVFVSFAHLFVGLYGLVVSFWLVLGLCLAFWMALLVVPLFCVVW